MQTIHSPKPKSETFKLSKILGFGGYGVVYLATNEKNTKFAMKVIDILPFSGDQREMDCLLREVDVLSRICHPNIITYHWSWQTDSKIYIQTEYCYYRDLWIFIKEHGRPEEEQFLEWIGQISSGLEHLHENGFLHRNVKPTNIMVTEEKILKLGDFGTARKFPSAGMDLTDYVGTPYYMSPEIMNRQPYSKSTDIWSLGCTCYAVSTLECINEGKTSWQQIISSDVLLENTKKIQLIPYSDTIKCIISRMLIATPSERPTARDVKIWIETTQQSDQTSPKCEKQVSPECEKTKGNLPVRISRKTDLSKTCPAEFFHGPFRSKFTPETTVDSIVSGASAASPKQDEDVKDASSTEFDYDIEFEIQRFLMNNLGHEKFISGLSCIQNSESDNSQAENDLIRVLGQETFRKYEIFFRQLRAIFVQERSRLNDQG